MPVIRSLGLRDDLPICRSAIEAQARGGGFDIR